MKQKFKVPLARLLRKDTPFVWGADQEQAFATLKQSLSEAPVLVRPDFDKEFAIQTDASDYAIGAVFDTRERRRLACEYWWPGMWYAVEEYCNSCDVCQRYKVPQTGPKGLMTRRVVDRPWAVVAADMMEFPRSKNQNKYLLVFQDLFTRWIEIVPLRKANGVNVLRAFEELVLFRWETPEFLLTDNGKEFDNAVMERNTNEEQRRSFAAVVRGATGRTAPSVRPAMDERAGASSSERNASEEARASQEAVAELNEYVRLMELGVPARLRPEPEGRAVVEVSGELIPVFARPSMHASEDAMDWEGSVQPGNYSWQRPAWQQRTDADRRRASRQRRQASGVGTRQRTPSPGEGRRPNGGGEPLLEEETRAMLEQLVAARQPVEEWDGEAFEEVFRGSPEEEVLLLEEGEATATLRRSGETTEESARVPTPPLAPVQEPSALPLPPPVQQVSYVAGLHGLVFQPFAVQQQRLPQRVSPRRATTAPASPPGALPRAATNIVSYLDGNRNNISERKSAWSNSITRRATARRASVREVITGARRIKCAPVAPASIIGVNCIGVLFRTPLSNARAGRGTYNPSSTQYYRFEAAVYVQSHSPAWRKSITSRASRAEQSRAEQSRAEQSRATRIRYENINLLVSGIHILSAMLKLFNFANFAVLSYLRLSRARKFQFAFYIHVAVSNFIPLNELVARVYVYLVHYAR
ncbi:unnamed protein product, partial [Trichogramma brassicae]